MFLLLTCFLGSEWVDDFNRRDLLKTLLTTFATIFILQPQQGADAKGLPLHFDIDEIPWEFQDGDVTYKIEQFPSFSPNATEYLFKAMNYKENTYFYYQQIYHTAYMDKEMIRYEIERKMRWFYQEYQKALKNPEKYGLTTG